MAPFDYGRRVDSSLFEAQLQGECRLDARHALIRGWELFKSRPGEFIGFTLIVFLVNTLSSSRNPLVSLAGVLLLTGLYPGYFLAAFRLASGRELRFSHFFRGFDHFLPLLLATLCVSIVVATGLILLVIPGLYLAVGYMFATTLIVDNGMEFWQAMEVSRRVVTRHWFAFFGFSLMLFLVNCLGLLLLGVGLIVSVPVSACALAIAYLQVFGERAEPE